MSQHPFLSDPWIEAARALHDAHRASLTPPPGMAVRMNLVIEQVPFGAGTLEAHLDTSSGLVEIDLGHLTAADVRVTLAYEIAHAILIEGNGQVAMQAFMAGEIRVEGDMAALLAAFSGQQGPVQGPITDELRAITAPVAKS